MLSTDQGGPGRVCVLLKPSSDLCSFSVSCVFHPLCPPPSCLLSFVSLAAGLPLTCGRLTSSSSSHVYWKSSLCWVPLFLSPVAVSFCLCPSIGDPRAQFSIHLFLDLSVTFCTFFLEKHSCTFLCLVVVFFPPLPLGLLSCFYPLF